MSSLAAVAIGASLSERVAGAIAACRGHADVALGNVLGSSIYNVLGIRGVTTMIAPIKILAAIARFDIWALAAATVVLLLFLRILWMLSRWEGGILLTG